MSKHEYITDRWRPQDDVPDEVWLKNFIEAYRRQERDMEQLRAYARGLEEENMLLQTRLKRSEKELQQQRDKEQPNVDEILAENKELKRLIRAASVMPQQLRRTKPLRTLLNHLNRYANELMATLLQNGITPPEPKLLPRNHPLFDADIDKLEIQMLTDYFAITKPSLAEQMKATDGTGAPSETPEDDNKSLARH